MAMQMRVWKREGGDVAIACGWLDGLVRMRREGAEARGKYIAWGVREREAVGGIQLVGKHDDALRMGRSPEL